MIDCDMSEPKVEIGTVMKVICNAKWNLNCHYYKEVEGKRIG